MITGNYKKFCRVEKKFSPGAFTTLPGWSNMNILGFTKAFAPSKLIPRLFTFVAGPFTELVCPSTAGAKGFTVTIECCTVVNSIFTDIFCSYTPVVHCCTAVAASITPISGCNTKVLR